MLLIGFKCWNHLNTHERVSDFFLRFVHTSLFFLNTEPCLSDHPKFVNYARE